MTEGKMVIVACSIKNFQQEMQGELTHIQDVFLQLKAEMQILSEKWKGTAAEEFKIKFWAAWDEMWQEIVGITRVISELVQVEADMEETERKVQDLLITGGGGMQWMK